jgi:hypothetical protein
MSDIVNHPPHYNSGRIEVIEAIEDWKVGFHRGNAIKYIARAGRKNPAKEIEDLEKARWYLAREIELIRSQAEDRDPCRPNDMAKEHEAEISYHEKQAEKRQTLQGRFLHPDDLPTRGG